MIIQLRGCMGSGKSTVARKLIDKYRMTPVGSLRGSRKRPEAYTSPDGEVIVLGPYVSACGGMDAIGNVADSIALIHKYANPARSQAPRVVFYEGMMLGHIYGRHGAAMLEAYGDNHIFAFLDTPLELCIERVENRRFMAGNTKSFDPKNVIDNHAAVESSRIRCIDHGCNVRYVRNRKALQLVDGHICAARV